MEDGVVIREEHELMREHGGDGIEEAGEAGIVDAFADGGCDAGGDIAIYFADEVEHLRVLTQRRQARLDRFEQIAMLVDATLRGFQEQAANDAGAFAFAALLLIER